MTTAEYQAACRRTQPRYMDNKDKLYHAVFGLNSEAGEVAGILQKSYQGHPYDAQRMIRELGDCLWMISEACDAIGVSMEGVMDVNIKKLMARYPEGFDSERSLHRQAGDV